MKLIDRRHSGGSPHVQVCKRRRAEAERVLCDDKVDSRFPQISPLLEDAQSLLTDTGPVQAWDNARLITVPLTASEIDPSPPNLATTSKGGHETRLQRLDPSARTGARVVIRHVFQSGQFRFSIVEFLVVLLLLRHFAKKFRSSTAEFHAQEVHLLTVSCRKDLRQRWRAEVSPHGQMVTHTMRGQTSFGTREWDVSEDLRLFHRVAILLRLLHLVRPQRSDAQNATHVGLRELRLCMLLDDLDQFLEEIGGVPWRCHLREVGVESFDTLEDAPRTVLRAEDILHVSCDQLAVAVLALGGQRRRGLVLVVEKHFEPLRDEQHFSAASRRCLLVVDVGMVHDRPKNVETGVNWSEKKFVPEPPALGHVGRIMRQVCCSVDGHGELLATQKH